MSPDHKEIAYIKVGFSSTRTAGVYTGYRDSTNEQLVAQFANPAYAELRYNWSKDSPYILVSDALSALFR